MEKYNSHQYSVKNYSKRNIKNIMLNLKYKTDGSIIDELEKHKSDKAMLVKYAIYKKINRIKKIDTKILENQQSKTSKKNTRYNFKISSVNTDLLIDDLNESYIKNALMELIVEGYTEKELNNFKQKRKELQKNNIIMKPQFALYKSSSKDLEIFDILKQIDSEKNIYKDDFIKDAILEKYERDLKK